MSEEWRVRLIERLTDWKMLVFIVVILGAVLHKLDVGVFGGLSNEAVKIIRAVQGK